MRTITAVIKKKKLRTHWGFHFNTEIQGYVENAMQLMHFGSSDYWLSFKDEAPKGVYTDCEVKYSTVTKSFKVILKSIT